jgi:hypothetical protein
MENNLDRATTGFRAGSPDTAVLYLMTKVGMFRIYGFLGAILMIFLGAI